MVITGDIIPVGRYLPARIVDRPAVRKDASIGKTHPGDGRGGPRRAGGIEPHKTDGPQVATYGPDGRINHARLLVGLGIDTYA